MRNFAAWCGKEGEGRRATISGEIGESTHLSSTYPHSSFLVAKYVAPCLPLDLPYLALPPSRVGQQMPLYIYLCFPHIQQQ